MHSRVINPSETFANARSPLFRQIHFAQEGFEPRVTIEGRIHDAIDIYSISIHYGILLFL
jgi:hypothetical protein